MVLVLTVASQDGIPSKTYLQKSLIIIDFPEASTAATRRMVSNWTSAQIQYGHPSGNGKEVLKDMQLGAIQTMKHKTELLETIVGNTVATTGNITPELQRHASHCQWPIATSHSIKSPLPPMELSIDFIIPQQYLVNKVQVFCKSMSFYCK